MIIRNPYERIISGFLDKYREEHPWRKLWKNEKKLTFLNFIDVLDKEGTGRQIERSHFSPQINANWDDTLNIHKIYDIKNIDKWK